MIVLCSTYFYHKVSLFNLSKWIKGLFCIMFYQNILKFLITHHLKPKLKMYTLLWAMTCESWLRHTLLHYFEFIFSDYFKVKVILPSSKSFTFIIFLQNLLTLKSAVVALLFVTADCAEFSHKYAVHPNCMHHCVPGNIY